MFICFQILINRGCALEARNYLFSGIMSFKAKGICGESTLHRKIHTFVYLFVVVVLPSPTSVSKVSLSMESVFGSFHLPRPVRDEGDYFHTDFYL